MVDRTTAIKKVLKEKLVNSAHHGWQFQYRGTPVWWTSVGKMLIDEQDYFLLANV